MGKSWRWERVENLEDLRSLGCIFEFYVGFPAVAFFNGWPYYDTFFEVLWRSLQGEKSAPKCSKYKDR